MTDFRFKQQTEEHTIKTKYTLICPLLILWAIGFSTISYGKSPEAGEKSASGSSKHTAIVVVREETLIFDPLSPLHELHMRAHNAHMVFREKIIGLFVPKVAYKHRLQPFNVRQAIPVHYKVKKAPLKKNLRKKVAGWNGGKMPRTCGPEIRKAERP